MVTHPRGAVCVIAHRGASAYAPEHTTAAYDLALRLGSDVLELDVRRLADGTPVVVHDTTLRRTCGDPRAVAGLRRSDLCDLDPATRPLTLDEVFTIYGAATRYLVELKEPSNEDALRVVGAVHDHGLAERVVLQSFDHRALRRLRRVDAELPMHALYPPRMPARWLRVDLARASAWATGIAPAAGSVDAALVQAAHVRGLAVHAYTVNAEPEMQRLAGIGVDGLITDVPDRAAAISALPLAA